MAARTPPAPTLGDSAAGGPAPPAASLRRGPRRAQTKPRRDNMVDVKNDKPKVITGHVRNGRLVIDEPTDLPEGTEVELIVIRVILPNGEVLEGDALEEMLRRHGR